MVRQLDDLEPAQGDVRAGRLRSGQSHVVLEGRRGDFLQRLFSGEKLFRALTSVSGLTVHKGVIP